MDLPLFFAVISRYADSIPRKVTSMRLSRCPGVMLLFLLSSAVSLAAKTAPCIVPQKAGSALNKPICVSAHIYDVVEVSDGTQFLDVCSPSTPDDQCRFTIIIPMENRKTVGELGKYRGTDLEVRGTVRRIDDRAGIVLSDARQILRYKPSFKPNPVLAHGFNAEQSSLPVRDPNLRRQGGRRAFMNPKVQEPTNSK